MPRTVSRGSSRCRGPGQPGPRLPEKNGPLVSVDFALAGISKAYGATPVLVDVTLRGSRGRVHALVGENGAGKSTLLKVLTGGVRPDRGSLTVGTDSIDFERFDPNSARKLGIAIVHQEFALLPHLTVAENVYLGRELGTARHLDRKAMRDGAAELLRRVGSSIEPDVRVGGLSIAEAQLVEIAKALSTRARVLALDEPSAVLSGDELNCLFGVVERLRDDGVAILYVSHRMDEVFQLCDDFTVLKDGRVAGSGTIESTNRADLVRMMVGRDVSQTFPTPRTPVGPARLELRDFAVEGLPGGINLTVRSGEIVGVAGLGGSGRTRLAKGVFAAFPARGQLALDGQWRGPFASPAEAISAGVAYVPEDRKLSGLAITKSVSSNISLLSLARLSSWGVLGRKRERTQTEKLVGQFGIRTPSDGAAAAGSLSGGNQQKVVFAKWLDMNPRVVILDEPTRGIDVASKEEIYRVIRDLASQGVAFLVISSELIEVLGLSDRIVVMSGGRIVGELDRGATEEDVMCVITEADPSAAGAA